VVRARGARYECNGTSTPGICDSGTKVNLPQTAKIERRMPTHVYRAMNEGSVCFPHSSVEDCGPLEGLSILHIVEKRSKRWGQGTEMRV